MKSASPYFFRRCNWLRHKRASWLRAGERLPDRRRLIEWPWRAPAASPTGTISARPSAARSMQPGASVVTIGRLASAASIRTVGRPSECDGSTRRSAAAIAMATSSAGRVPRQIALGQFSSKPPSGPLPIATPRSCVSRKDFRRGREFFNALARHHAADIERDRAIMRQSQSRARFTDGGEDC